MIRHSIFIFGALYLGMMSFSVVTQANIKETYAQFCSSCHGKDLSGGMAGPLTDDVWEKGGSADEIAATIRNGILDMGMPAWGTSLSDEQIRALVIFIKEEKSKAAKAQLGEKLMPKDGVFNTSGHRFKMETIFEQEGIFWGLDFMPGGGVLTTQREGKLWLTENNKTVEITNMPEVWQRGQGGLLDVKRHPNYEKNGWIYLSLSENTGGEDNGKPAGMTKVIRGKIDKNKWVEEQTIYSIDKSLHSSAGAHFGSRFVIHDGYLYFGIGDRGRQPFVQDLSRPNGKIFRLHDDGRVPKDNPFIKTPKALPEIWSYGHRNPQGLDLDPESGLIWSSEHGPRGGDELNIIRKGVNYGWPEITYGMNYNGTPMTAETHREGMEQPKHYWVPSIAVAGIDFYEGDTFSKWKGKMLVAGMVTEELHIVTIENGRILNDEIILKDQGRVRDVASAPNGDIYLLLNTKSPKKGRVVKLTAL